MNSENTDYDDIFNEDDEVEEGEVVEGNNEEEGKEDDDEEQEWGGENQVINPENNFIAAIIGVPPIFLEYAGIMTPPIEQPVAPTVSPVIAPIQHAGRVRRREENNSPLPQKTYRNEAGKRIIRQREPFYTYLKLKSGEEFHFKEEDGKNLLLNESIEPNRLIRNIISKTPVRLVERLEYLGKFAVDEESDVEDSEDENSKKVQKRYLGNLNEAVYSAYIKEWRLRFIFKRLIILWRVYKMNKACEKEIDPITLSEPEKEVYVYDWNNKRKFVFDAKSLATLIESKLMYHEYGFPVPMYPRNPKNNVEFSYKQMISLYYQLKAHGELRWGFTTLREYNFNKNRWHMYHKSALTMNSIKNSITLLDTFEARELLTDFIFAKMDELGLNYTNYIFNSYQAAMIKVPTHWYLEKLKSLAISHYEATHFGHNRTRIINAMCVRVFRKNNKFMKDLRTKNIIT